LETLEVRKDENCGTEIVFFSLLENRFPGQISFTLKIANASKLSFRLEMIRGSIGLRED